MINVTLLDIPAMQCTSTFVLFRQSSINWLASSKQQLISKDSWSTAGMYRYSICLGSRESRFLPLTAEMTASIPNPTIDHKLLWSVRGFSATSILETQMPPRPEMGSTTHSISSGNFCCKALNIECQYNKFLLMEKLPPIDAMYRSMLQHHDYDVLRKYQNTRVNTELKKSPTKKHNFLDDAIKMNCSPGPANISNIQRQWAKPNKLLAKHCDRRTYIDEIKLNAKRRNSPSPNQYQIKVKWPEEKKKPFHSSQKTSFLDNSQFQASRTPGPGNYIVSKPIGKKARQYHYNATKPLQPHKQISACMVTYDPVPRDYATFKAYEKFNKFTTKLSPTRPAPSSKHHKENSSPGPGQYQMIHTWQGKERKLPSGSSTYLSRITKTPSTNFYYN